MIDELISHRLTSCSDKENKKVLVPQLEAAGNFFEGFSTLSLCSIFFF